MSDAEQARLLPFHLDEPMDSFVLILSPGEPCFRNNIRFFDALLMDATISFTVNGKRQTISTDPERSLLEVLREDLQLTGTKFGCGEGQCRACTVLINGRSVPSCITRVGGVDKAEVVTIEGLASGDKLHVVQEVFLAEGAFQCGYCTAGMILGLVGALNENPKATEPELMSEMQRHICRCGSYPKYVQAIRRVMAGAGGGRV